MAELDTVYNCSKEISTPTVEDTVNLPSKNPTRHFDRQALADRSTVSTSGGLDLCNHYSGKVKAHGTFDEIRRDKLDSETC